MRRLVTLTITAAFVMALTAVPASSQVAPPEPPGDLGLEIAPVEGFPGDPIIGQVDVDDLAAHCNTELDEDGFPQDWLDIFGENYQEWIDAYDAAFDPPEAEGSPEGSAFLALGDLFLLGVVGVPAFGVDPNPAPFFSSFAFVFADIATQEPIEVVSDGIDPFTGETETLITPEVDPGLYAVAAACNNIAPTPDAEGLEAMNQGVQALTGLIVEFAESDDEPCLDNGDPFGDLPGCIIPPPLGTDETEFLADSLGVVMPEVLPGLFAQWALGAELYCVLDEDGECNGEVPADPLDPAAPAEPVTTDPTFTG